MRKDEVSYGNMLLYTMDGRHFTFVEIRFELDDKINDEIMEKAYAKTCRRFPYYFVTMAEEDGCLYTKPNPKTPLVHHDPLDYVIDYKDNDGFLFRLSTLENTVTISWFHGLTDGAGIFNFFKVLLTEYYRLSGEDVVPPEDLFDINAAPTEEEYIIPLDLVPDTSETTPAPFGNHFKIPGKPLKNLESYTFSAKLDNFMDFAHNYCGSPNSIAQIEIARCILETYPKAKNESVGVSVAINSKPFLKVPNAYRGCLSISVFGFKEEDFHSDYKELNKRVRKNIANDVKDENLIPFLSATKEVFKIMDHMHDVRTKQLLCYQATTGAVATIAESYVGAVKFGSIEKHINSIYSIVEASLPLVEINYANGTFFISATAKVDISKLMENFYNRFISLGFKCSPLSKMVMKTETKKTGFPKMGLNPTTFKMDKAVNEYTKESKKGR